MDSTSTHRQGQCVGCPEGSFSNWSSAPWVCRTCPRGQYQPFSGSASCLDCPTGTVTSSDRRLCKSCQPGEYVFNASTCVSCPLATFAPVPLDNGCKPCLAGFATGARSAATSCTACPVGRASSVDRLACDVAETGFYIDPTGSGEVYGCPSHGVCDGGSALPRPSPGRWVDQGLQTLTV